MRNKFLFVVVLLLLLILGAWWIIHQIAQSEKEAGKLGYLANLHSIGRAIEAYRNANAGSYPETLQSLYPKYLEYRNILSLHEDYQESTDDAKAISYVYFKPETPPAPGEIIVRDKPGSHHRLNGYAALYADGTVKWIDGKP